MSNTGGSDALGTALEDAICGALDAEGGAPHSGVDMKWVVGEGIRRLAVSGFAFRPPFVGETTRTGKRRGYRDHKAWASGA